MKLHQLSPISALSTFFQNPLPLLGGILLCFLPARDAHAQGMTFDWSQATLFSASTVTYSAVTVDGSGNIFVSASGIGGESIEEIVAANGSIPANPTINTIVSGFSASALAADAGGNLYVAYPNSSGLSKILAVDGSIPATPVTETLGTGQITNPIALAIDPGGDLFVGSSSGTVQEILAVNGSIPTSPTIKTVVSGFKNPGGVAVDGSGNIYVADSVSITVSEVLAVNGSIPADPKIRILADDHLLGDPNGVAVDAKGDVFITDEEYPWVIEYLAVDGSIPTKHSTFTDLGFGGGHPSSVAVDQNGNVFATNQAYTPPNPVFEFQLGSVNFGTVNICPAGKTAIPPCSNTITLEYSFPVDSTAVGGVNILTSGVKNLDFQAEANDTSTTLCSPAQKPPYGVCTVDVTFAPLAPGLRSGTVQLVDKSGNILVSTSIYGISPNQTITFPAIGAQYAGTEVALSATASSGLPVTFASSTPAICTVTADTANLVSNGYCEIEASQAGNATNTAATTEQTFLVRHQTQDIDFPTISPQVASFQVILDATASSGLPVVFSSRTPTVCTVRGDRATLLIAGYCSVIANAAGNDEYFPAVTGQTFLVHHRDQVLTFDAIPSQTAGIMLALTATTNSELPITYDSTTPSVCTVSGSTASLIGTGTCTIQASQAGNAAWFPSGPKGVSFTVTP
jgi:sugar lactone lactonase YvrE